MTKWWGGGGGALEGGQGNIIGHLCLTDWFYKKFVSGLSEQLYEDTSTMTAFDMKHKNLVRILHLKFFLLGKVILVAPLSYRGFCFPWVLQLALSLNPRSWVSQNSLIAFLFCWEKPLKRFLFSEPVNNDMIFFFFCLLIWRITSFFLTLDQPLIPYVTGLSLLIF